MKFIMLILCLLSIVSMKAQDLKLSDVEGVYKLKSSSPEGGTTIILLPDNLYAISYFGGIQKGTYALDGSRIIMTRSAEPRFAVYGRNQDSLSHQLQFSFMVEPESALVKFGSSKDTLFTRVFNEQANCFSSPYIHKLEKRIRKIQLGHNTDDSYRTVEKELYEFELPEEYNDFIIINLTGEYTSPQVFRADFQEGKLFFDSSAGVQRRPLSSLGEEDKIFLTQHTANAILPQKLEPGSEFFPLYDENDQRITNLRPFEQVEGISLPIKSFSLADKSLFVATCDDD